MEDIGDGVERVDPWYEVGEVKALSWVLVGDGCMDDAEAVEIGETSVPWSSIEVLNVSGLLVLCDGRTLSTMISLPSRSAVLVEFCADLMRLPISMNVARQRSEVVA